MKPKEAEYFKACQQGNLTYFKSLSLSDATNQSWLMKAYPKSGDTAVHYASRCGHLSVLQFLQERGIPFETANLDGKRALHEAAQAGQLHCLNFLLQCGVQVDSLKRADWTPLMLACTKHNLDVIRALVDHGADPAVTNKDGWNSFHIACREGDISLVRYLHELNYKLWDTVSKNGRTPLHTAALHGCLEVTRYLLDHCGYTPDTPDSCGSTPLMDALRSEHLDVSDLLIQKHEADVSKGDNLGHQAIHLAAQAGSTRAIDYLVTNYAVSPSSTSELTGTTPLHVAAKEGQLEVIRQLLSLGADVHATDKKGRTALHIASGAGHSSCVEHLLIHGAQNLHDNSGRTPQQLAQTPEVKKLFENLGT